MTKQKRRQTITAQLRQAIKASGQSRYAIAKGAGIDYAALHRFMSGKDLRLDSAAKLALYLGLNLK